MSCSCYCDLPFRKKILLSHDPATTNAHSGFAVMLPRHLDLRLTHGSKSDERNRIEPQSEVYNRKNQPSRSDGRMKQLCAWFTRRPAGYASIPPSSGFPGVLQVILSTRTRALWIPNEASKKSAMRSATPANSLCLEDNVARIPEVKAKRLHRSASEISRTSSTFHLKYPINRFDTQLEPLLPEDPMHRTISRQADIASFKPVLVERILERVSRSWLRALLEAPHRIPNVPNAY
eukprot:1371527-Amorphochlora_amoeboformis.AAC.1